MIIAETIHPKYKAETKYQVYLYGNTSVSKEFYDLLWVQFVHFLPGMHFGNVYSVYEFLGDSDILGFLGEDGIKAADKCLLHIAHAGLLPFEFECEADGISHFKSL
jgi:hypothetical protein